MAEVVSAMERGFRARRGLAAVVEAVLPGRSSAQYSLAGLVGAGGRPDPLLAGKKQQSRYQLPADRSELLAMPFYRLHLSQTKAHVALFVELRGCLRKLGLRFPNEKRDSEAVVVVLGDLLEELVARGYCPGQHSVAEAALRAAVGEELSLPEELPEEKLEALMDAFDRALEAYLAIIGADLAGVAEQRTPFHPAQLPQLPLEVSDEEVVFKAESQSAATFADESTLRQFREEDDEPLQRIGGETATVLERFEANFGPALRANPCYLGNLARALELLLQRERQSDELLDSLLAFLDDNFEAALFLLEARERVAEEVGEQLRREAEARSRGASYANVATNVVFTRGKRRGKEGTGVTPELLGRMGLGDAKPAANVLQEELGQRRRQHAVALDDLDEKIDFMQASAGMLNSKFGMTRVEKQGFVALDVKPAQKNELYKVTERGEVAVLFPPHLHKAFDDGPTLNKLQTLAYSAIFGSDENILCCAPTGAGKTNVALMAVLRSLDRHFDTQTGRVGQGFKVVYISPLKALATELVGKFARKLACLGVVVRELTGDVSLSRKEIASSHIIVSTPEKWDVITRKSAELNMMFSLLVVDEIHLLDEVRGRTIESLVARTLQLTANKQCRIRLVGLSATLPNYKDVARFLHVSAAGR